MKNLQIKPATLVILLASMFCTAAQAQVSLTSGLVAYYPFTVNAHDVSGKRNDAAVIGYDWKFSHGLFLNTITPPTNSFSGLDETYVIAPRSASLDFNQDFTLSVWVNIPKGLPVYYVHNIIGNGPDDSSANFRIVSDVTVSPDADYLQFVCNHATGDIHAFVEPLRNIWWQAVAVRSGTTVSLFRDGLLLTNALMTATVTNLPTIWIGRYSCACPASDCPSSYSLSGGIGDVQMYNRALSTNEVFQLYRREKGAFR